MEGGYEGGGKDMVDEIIMGSFLSTTRWRAQFHAALKMIVIGWG